MSAGDRLPLRRAESDLLQDLGRPSLRVRLRRLAHHENPTDSHQPGPNLGGDRRFGETPRRDGLELLTAPFGSGHRLGPALDHLDSTLDSEQGRCLPEPGTAPLPTLDEDRPRLGPARADHEARDPPARPQIGEVPGFTPEGTLDRNARSPRRGVI